MIGILPGRLWGTKEDEILVIGAHWDTFPFSSGMDDNGSGVTALLEVIPSITVDVCIFNMQFVSITCLNKSFGTSESRATS